MIGVIRIGWVVALLASSLLSQVAGASYGHAHARHPADLVPRSAGVTVTLETSAGHRFLGLLERAAHPRASVILVHGAGAHFDTGLIGRLRVLLAKRGFTTLSIQMPVPRADTPRKDYAAQLPAAGRRLEAAIAYLRARGMKHIALLSHGMGTQIANDFVTRHPNAPLLAWLPVSAANGRLQALSHVRFPVFDVYAEHDRAAIVHGATARAKVLRGHHGWKQAMVYGADHNFTGKEDELAALVEELLTPLVK